VQLDCLSLKNNQTNSVFYNYKLSRPRPRNTVEIGEADSGAITLANPNRKHGDANEKPTIGNRSNYGNATWYTGYGWMA
jgi:hypothetical protein